MLSVVFCDEPFDFKNNKTSPLVILPSFPVPCMIFASISFSKINFLAAGITKSKFLSFILFIKIKLYSAARISFLFGLIKFNDSLTILSCSFRCLESEPVAGDAASVLPT